MQPKLPVESLGRILYSELHGGEWFDYPKVDPIYEQICDCAGFSIKDKPFSVVKHLKPAEKMFCVVYHWRNDKGFKNRSVRVYGRDEERMDSDTYYMTEVLERHATESAAKKAMRRFAAEAFAKVNDAPSYGEVCHNTIEGDKEVKLRVGDTVVYSYLPGIVWRVNGEVRKNDSWYTKIVPVLSFFVNNGTDNKERELRNVDVMHYVHHINIVEMGTLYTKLGLFLQDEARRRSE